MKCTCRNACFSAWIISTLPSQFFVLSLLTLTQFDTSQANDTLLDHSLDTADLADDIANLNTASKIHGELQGSDLAQVGPKPRLLLMGLKR